MEEKFTIVHIGGESDGKVLTVGERPNRQPRTAKRQTYEFLSEGPDSKTFFYFFPKEASREKAMEKANAWINENLKN